MAAHPQDYTIEAMKKKSNCAASLMEYVLNMIEAKDTYSQLEELNMDVNIFENK